MALKILLADDSMTAQNMGKKILVDAGYDVVAVSNGAAAIKKIASDQPDIIILDVYMPGYTGLEVCERVKGASETSRTPVLLTVGKMEPFKPEEANRVRADGVMIKPFEATDLIAVIQSIANKMTAVAPMPRDTVRIAPPMPSLDHTTLIAPPPHDDTVRVPPPRGNQSHPAYEETMRLTPEQIRSLQDKSYKDWVASAEVESVEKPAAEAVPEMAVSSAAAEAQEPIPVESLIVPSILEPLEPPVLSTEPEPARPIMPGLDSSESHMARAMAGTMPEHDFFTVTPPAHQFSPDTEAPETPAMYSASEEMAPATPSQPFFTLQQHTEPEPEPIKFVAEGPSVIEPVTHELETSAPITPGPAFVSQLEELEPTVAPPLEVVAEAVPELEINSPIHVQPEVVVSTDPALITSDDDMSQFVTKFGQEGAEEVHVGVAADLPPEQLAALTMPQFETAAPEIRQEVPELEPPDFVVPPMVDLELLEPVVQELAVEPEAPVTEAHTNVFDEVGTIAAEESLSGTGPMVAYVPTLDDTQPIPPYVESEPAVVSEPEPVIATAEPELITEPGPVSAISTEPVYEVAHTHQVEEPISTMHMVEVASAVAVGGAAISEAAHFFTVAEPEAAVEEPAPLMGEHSPVESFAPAMQESQPEVPAEVVAEPLVSAEAEEAVPEPVGDAALAEELAAALDDREAEERATAAAQAAISTLVEPAAAAAESMTGSDVLGISDGKLSEAVSHALEKLRPQLIAEILKELMK